MNLILTSMLMDLYGLLTVNQLKKQLETLLPRQLRILFVASEPFAKGANRQEAEEMRRIWIREGWQVQSMEVLDGAYLAPSPKLGDVASLVAGSNVVLLSGGHVPTQNSFLRGVKLQKALEGFQGTVIGISAGAMNAARTVYALPERRGEAKDPRYQRFLPGLGLTSIHVLPHYSSMEGDRLDGLRVMEDMVYPDSKGRTFYTLNDGSYLIQTDQATTLYGESYRIAHGKVELICEDGQVLELVK